MCYFSEIWHLDRWVHLKLVYEVLKQITLNWNMQRHTKAHAAKSSSDTLLRYYAAQRGNSLPTIQDNLSVPSSEIKISKRENRTRMMLTDTIFFFVGGGGVLFQSSNFLRSPTFQKLALVWFSGKAAPNLFDQLDWVILNHWTPQKH